jgi:two-component system NtrC family response regulator
VSIKQMDTASNEIGTESPRAARIVIVDDDENTAMLTKRSLRNPNYIFELCTGGEAALIAVKQSGADVMLAEINLPRMSGLELLRKVRQSFPRLPVILMTSQGSIPDAVIAMREGAFGYLTYPINDIEMVTLVERAIRLKSLEQENLYLRAQAKQQNGTESFIAVSQSNRTLLSFVKRIAPSSSSVVIEGESGTGKELVAQLLHFWSNRVGQPFIAVNCKSLSDGVLESELFGHEKGAFTGAVGSHAGCFERAGGGTLFLDEIGDIGLEFQAKLLRVLQEHEVQRVGGSHTIKVDVRIIAATNRSLTGEVEAGRFREDLYFRLAVIPVKIAPLRERRDDILPLANYFLSRQTASTRPLQSISPRAQQALVAHPWRGNVRELENAIERAVLLSSSDVIEPEDLLLISVHRSSTETPKLPVSLGPLSTLQEALDLAASRRIADALEVAGGNRSSTARALGVDRATLYRYIKRFSL